jgi:hypothetical protein
MIIISYYFPASSLLSNHFDSGVQFCICFSLGKFVNPSDVLLPKYNGQHPLSVFLLLHTITGNCAFPRADGNAINYDLRFK